MLDLAIEEVREYFKQFNKENDVVEHEVSSATVELAAKALNVIPARIAKTLSFKINDSAILVVAAGDTKIDNKKFKAEFGCKAKMLTPEEALEFTGHAVGGICPFALKNNISVYLDESMKRFETVFPAAGSSNSSIELTCEELSKYSNCAKWVDVCKGYEMNSMEY